MSGYALWTELAIWVLVVGTPVVFAWFLKDAARLIRGLGREEPDEPEDPDRDRAGSGPA